VREGELGIWDEKKRQKKIRYFFLFNDILLLCKKESSKRYWLRIHITLRSPSVTIEEIGNSSFNNEFRLHCRSRSFMLYAPTPDAKEDWVKDLQRAIKGEFAQEEKDKKVLKQGQDLVKDGDGVKKISKKKRAEAEQQQSEDSAEEEEQEEKPKERKKRPKKEKKPAEVSPTNALLLDLLGPTSPTNSSPGLNLGVGLAGTSGNPFLSGANPFSAAPTNIYSSGSGTQPVLNAYAAPNIYGSNGGTSANAGFSNTSPFGAPTGYATPPGGASLYGGGPASNPFAPSGSSGSFSAGGTSGNPFLGGGGGGSIGVGVNMGGVGNGNNSLSVFGNPNPSFGAPAANPNANPFGVPSSSANPFMNSGTPNGGFF